MNSQMQAQQTALGQQMAMDPAMQLLAAQQMQLQMSGMGMNSAMGGRVLMPMDMGIMGVPGQYPVGGY